MCGHDDVANSTARFEVEPATFPFWEGRVAGIPHIFVFYVSTSTLRPSSRLSMPLGIAKRVSINTESISDRFF